MTREVAVSDGRERRAGATTAQAARSLGLRIGWLGPARPFVLNVTARSLMRSAEIPITSADLSSVALIPVLDEHLGLARQSRVEMQSLCDCRHKHRHHRL